MVLIELDVPDDVLYVFESIIEGRFMDPSPEKKRELVQQYMVQVLERYGPVQTYRRLQRER